MHVICNDIWLFRNYMLRNTLRFERNNHIFTNATVISIVKNGFNVNKYHTQADKKNNVLFLRKNTR